MEEFLETMKIFKNNQKALYVLSCLIISIFLYGCKEKEGKISVFDGLPESTFLTEIKTSLESHTPLAIAFTAEWCPHCRKYKPVFNEVKDLYRDKVTFINIDVDDANGSPVSNRFQIRGIPTTGFVRADGSVFKVQVGEISKDDLVKIADELILNKKRKKGEPVAPFPLDIKKEEPAPQEKQKEEETKPVEEAPVIPPPAEKPGVELLQPQNNEELKMPIPMGPGEIINPPSPLQFNGSPNEEIQLPPPSNENEQNDTLDDSETLPEEEAAP